MSSTHSLGGRAETMMDSDVGTLTSDDRAEALRLLDLANARRESDSDDDDDDIGESEFYPPPPQARAPEQKHSRVRTRLANQPVSVVQPRPAMHTAPPPRPTTHAPAIVPPTPLSGRSESPVNDEDDQDGARAPPPAQPANRPRAPPTVRAEDMFSMPATPHEALIRYDASMNYLVEMLSQLTGDNTNAVTAKLSLEIFRRQMHMWHGDVEQNDWEKASKSMLMFSETVRAVIHSTVQRVKEQRGAERPVARPRVASTPRTAETEHARVSRAIPSATPTDSESSAPAPKPAVPMGLHYNPYKPEPSAPDYVTHADDAQAQKRNTDGCAVM